LTIKLTQHVVPIRPFPRGCLLVLRKLAFPQIAPPAISLVRTRIPKCARQDSGGLLEQNLQLSDSQTSATATGCAHCRSSECQPIQLSKNLHPEPVRAPSARGTATGGYGTAEVLFFLVWWDLPARLRELAFQHCLN